MQFLQIHNHLQHHLKEKVGDYILNQQWRISPEVYLHFPILINLLDYIVTFYENITSPPLILSRYSNIWICMCPDGRIKIDNHIPCIKVFKALLFDLFRKFFGTFLNRSPKGFIAIFYIIPRQTQNYR